MKKLLLCLLVIGLSFSVSAAVKKVEHGGHWDYGSQIQLHATREAWSNLFSSVRAHGSSVIIGEKSSSSWVKAGYNSKAWQWNSVWKTAYCYYRY